MIASAEHEGNRDLIGRLKADLKRYDNAQSCRPVGESSLMETLVP
jgi:hypothetical protein